jgi:CheY-like chemotaxis protein
MFTQIDPSLERVQGGLGVGLALAKRLVELHGGSIGVTSEGLGRGSEFVVRLPALPPGDPGTPAKERSMEIAERQVRRRILVADDNADSAHVLATALRLGGHEVETASDGSSAIEAARRLDPEVVILDIGMPKVNGYDVAKELRARVGRRILLIAITGWGKEEDKRRAAEAGFDHHLTKPVELQAIVELLARHSAESAG